MDNYKRLLIVMVIVFLFVAVVVILINREKKDITEPVPQKEMVSKKQPKIQEPVQTPFEQIPTGFPQMPQKEEPPKVTREEKKPAEKVSIFEEEPQRENPSSSESETEEGTGYEGSAAAPSSGTKPSEKDKINALPKGIILY